MPTPPSVGSLGTVERRRRKTSSPDHRVWREFGQARRVAFDTLRSAADLWRSSNAIRTRSRIWKRERAHSLRSRRRLRCATFIVFVGVEHNLRPRLVTPFRQTLAEMVNWGSFKRDRALPKACRKPSRPRTPYLTLRPQMAGYRKGRGDF